jgi:hypothetical protein
VAADRELLREKLETMAKAAAAKSPLRRLGQLFSETVLVDVDGNEFFLTFEKGGVIEIKQGPSLKAPWRFALRVNGDVLMKFWEAVPRPGYHDRFGLVKYGHGRIDGDILALVKNLRFFKEFMALGRTEAGV